MTIKLFDIESGFTGFQRLIGLHNELSKISEHDIDIDMSWVTTIDAHMCSAIGAILNPIHAAGKQLRLTGLRPSVATPLQQNGFLSTCGIGMPRIPDPGGTSIEYRIFEPAEETAFAAYVEARFVGKGMPAMSQAMHRRILSNITELFGNAALHSQTEKGIFACGQYYPHKARFVFSVADRGIGMKDNILSTLKLQFTGSQAIIWSMNAKNTTRTGSIPGGLGLKQLHDFISINGGRIEIASDDGYVEWRGRSVLERTFASPFPGTVVNIEINTADLHSYRLASEVNPNDVL